jgi:transcription termination/antitermination protein NusG
MFQRLRPGSNAVPTAEADFQAPPLPANYLENRWYAARTKSRHEKKVAEHLAGKGIVNFLPLYKAQHRWKDRVARVDLPLFPGYIFVQFPLKERLKVLEIPGVANLVSFKGEPAALPEQEIETLRQGLSANVFAEPHPYLKVGRRVRIKGGPLRGLEGILERKKEDSFRVVISIDLIMRSVLVEVAMADVELA